MMCVCCSDTVSRSGVYCAVSNGIEQCKAEGVIDVFQAVKLLRMNKPGAVDSIVSTNDHYSVCVDNTRLCYRSSTVQYMTQWQHSLLQMKHTPTSYRTLVNVL